MNMQVNLEYYKTFLVVARHLNITTAAKELGVSQPAVTKTIKMLETQLGGQLFTRSKNGLALTAEGRELFIKVDGALNILQDVENDFNERQKLESGELRIGISTILTKIYLMPYLITFKKAHPKVQIKIQNGLTSDLLHLLKKGALDIVICNDNLDHKSAAAMGLLTDELGQIQYSCIYNTGYFKDVTEKDLKTLPFILQNPGSFSRKLFDSFAAKHHFEPQVALEVTSHELGYEFVKNGLGIGFTYSKMIRDDFIKPVPLKQPIYSSVILAQNNNAVMTNIAKAFIRMLKES